jgi:lysophospholipase L1-like esterase
MLGLEQMGMEGMGRQRQGGADLFWQYNKALKSQDLLKVSAFGDSITAGDFNYANQPNIWFPNKANDILATSARTVTTGADLFQHAVDVSKITPSTQVVQNGNQFTLTVDGVQPNPRFTMNMENGILANTAAGELYLVSSDFDTTNLPSPHQLTLRVMPVSAAWGLLADTNPVYYTTNTGGYLRSSMVLSTDRLLQSYSTMAHLALGGEINADSNHQHVGVLRNLSFYKLSRGVSIINQGVSGDDAAAGLARIATVTGWTPNVCVVAFGTNDIRAAGDVNANLATYKTNLTSIVNALKAANCYPVLANIPVLAADQANYTYVPTWNGEIKALAASLQVGYWDRYSLLALADIEDGRHPTAAGYLKLAQGLAGHFN